MRELVGLPPRTPESEEDFSRRATWRHKKHRLGLLSAKDLIEEEKCDDLEQLRLLLLEPYSAIVDRPAPTKRKPGQHFRETDSDFRERSRALVETTEQKINQLRELAGLSPMPGRDMHHVYRTCWPEIRCRLGICSNNGTMERRNRELRCQIDQLNVELRQTRELVNSRTEIIESREKVIKALKEDLVGAEREKWMQNGEEEWISRVYATKLWRYEQVEPLVGACRACQDHEERGAHTY
ncbi:hypothetical protein BJ508DRAFT_330857 [Ascobolus immersus RN42]|uniref:Uncharacterized protein n=1 Tax=Ascobolus immersus RN42 TaxID=1160509 RepID=A0A3N4HSN0_ASCIM|nr:hypothetical protein BJ508DRAFT_330857 [Ascobolus immersus RN42]